MLKIFPNICISYSEGCLFLFISFNQEGHIKDNFLFITPIWQKKAGPLEGKKHKRQ